MNERDRDRDYDRGRDRKGDDRGRDREHDDRGSGFIPRNGLALAGYYMGFLALIFSLGGFALVMYLARSGNVAAFIQWSPIIVFGMMYGLGGICALLGVILGGIGLSKSGERGGTGHAVVGLVLGILVILGLILILLLGAVAQGR